MGTPPSSCVAGVCNLIDVEATHMMCLEVHALSGNGCLLLRFCCLAMAFAALVIVAADCLAARVSSLSTAAAAVATF